MPFWPTHVKRHKRHLFWILPTVLVLVGWLGVNPLCESALEDYLREKVRSQNASGGMSLSYEDLDLDVFSQKFTLHNLSASPVSDTAAHAFRNLKVNRATIHGIGLSNFLWNKAIEVHQIRLDSVQITLKKMPRVTRHDQHTPPASHPMLPDSLQLPGLTGVSLGAFEMESFGLLVLGPEALDTLAYFRGDQVRLEGVGLRQAVKDNPTFIPDISNMAFEMGRQQYVVSDGLYAVGFDQLRYDAAARNLQINQFSYAPAVGPDTLASAYRYSYERYTVGFNRMEMREVRLLPLFTQGSLHINTIALDSLKAEIFRDKSLPYDTGKHANLPVQALEKLRFPVQVDSLLLTNAYLRYAESLPDTEQQVSVDFQDFQGEFLNIHTAELAAENPDPLRLSLNTNLLGAIPVSLRVELPYGSTAVHLSGSTRGSSRLANLNPTVYPAMNMRFTGGTLNGMEFRASGNTHHLHGELTMLYTDLDVTFLNQDHETKKTLSWAVNALVKHSNPNRRGRTVVGTMETERVPYKGLGNFIWKAIQSGVVNSLNPVGKHHRE